MFVTFNVEHTTLQAELDEPPDPPLFDAQFAVFDAYIETRTWFEAYVPTFDAYIAVFETGTMLLQ